MIFGFYNILSMYQNLLMIVVNLYKTCQSIMGRVFKYLNKKMKSHKLHLPKDQQAKDRKREDLKNRYKNLKNKKQQLK